MSNGYGLGSRVRKESLWRASHVPISPKPKVACHLQYWRETFSQILGCLIATLTLGFSNAYALDAAVQNGLSWLQGQVQSDGTIASETNSIATRFQVRTETANALRDLASVPPSLIDTIQAESENNNEYVSRRLLVSTGAVSGTDALNELTARQNQDGGVGGIPLYQSNPLDTAYGLMLAKTLAAKGYDVSQIVSRGLSYLASAQGADGSWASDSQGNIFVTSVVLSAVQEWYSIYSVGAMTAKAKDWLLAKRTAGAYSQVVETATGLYALSGQTSAIDVVGPLADSLRSAQGVDGSWGEDPYVTALALRALWTSSKPLQPASTTGEITGRVVDTVNGSVISQAALQLIENTNFSSASGSEGKFTLSGIVPGVYTLRVSKLGYEPRQLVVTVVAGETVSFGDIALKPQALTASISGVVKTTSGAAVADVVVSVGTVSTATSSTGAYSLKGLSPGSTSISATKSGYLTATANVSFVAGASYTFSPTLYTSNAPTTATLRGKLTDATSGIVISGGVVTLGGASVSTAADGSFEFSGLPSGGFTLAISAAGYQQVTASGSLSLGINDLGKLSLQRLPTVSTLSGKVVDADSGLPLAGAQITLQGSTQTTVSASDGTYSIPDVMGTSLVLNVGATGYQSATFNLVLTSPGNIVEDFPLLKLQPSGIAITEIKLDKEYFAPYDKLEVDVKVANSNTTPTDLVIEAQVLDALNNVSFEMPANANGLGLNPPNLPVTLTAASSRDLELFHFMIRESGGQHTILVRAHDISGHVVAEGTATFIVRDEALLGGGLAITPPLAQAATDLPVNFTAQLGNFGNQPIESTSAELVVTLENPDTNVSTRPETSVSQITSNTLINPAKSLARDKSGNLYAVKSGYNDGRVIRIDSAGSATVFATVPKTTGAPSLVDILVDSQDNVWAADANGRLWKITQSGVITESKLASLTALTGFDISASGDIYASGTNPTGKQALVKRDALGVETLLWSNGLSTPVGIVSDGVGGYVVSNSGDGTLVKMSATGSVSLFASGLSTPKGIVRDGSGNYFVVNSGNGSVVKVSPDGARTTVTNGLPQPADIALRGGDLFVTTWGDASVYRISSSGVAERYVSSLANRPQGIKYDASGNLFIAGDDGSLRKKDALGQVSIVATGISSPRGVDVTPSGEILVASYGAGSVVRVSGSDKSNFITGLSGPYGVAASPVGEVWVTEQNQNRLARLGTDGSLLERVESVLVNPNDIVAAPDGRVWVANTNYITLVDGGSPSIGSRGRTYSKLAYDPSTDGLVGLSGYDVYRIDGSGNAVKVKTLSSYSYDISADPAGDIIVTNGSTIQKLDSSGGLTTLASFPSTVQAVSSDSTGRHFVMAGGKLYRTETDYTVTPLPVPNNEYAYWTNVGADGQLIVWTNYGRLYRVNPDTVTFVIVSGISSVTSAVSDATGGINVVVSSRHELSRYDTSGALQSRVTGFSAPKDAVWYIDGVRFTDATGRMFHATSGQLPVLIGGGLNPAYLAVSGADLYATSGTNLYKWNGASWSAVKSIANATNLTGIAIRQDGAITVGDNTYSRIVTVNSSGYATLQDYGGLVTPWGIDVASDGSIYVADYGSSTVSRLQGKGEPPVFQARISNARYLTAEPAGTLLVSRSAAIDRLNPATGAVTTLPSVPGQPEKILVDGSRILAVDSQGRVFKFENNAWSLLASGINSTRALGVQDDRVYLLNGNGTLTVYQSGQLDVLADTGIAQPRSLTHTSNGWLAGGDSGAMAMIDPGGAVTPINIASLISNKPVYGLHELSSESSALLAGDGSGYTLSRLSITQPQEPPLAGTIVYSASLPISSLPSGEGLLTLDYGSWVPPHGGGFRAEVTVPGAMGSAANYLYVGPHAQGLLSTTSDEQAPGNQTVPFDLNVTGADFVTLSRVETGLIRPLTSIGQPYGMVGDKSGNLWYTDATALYRKSTAGINDTMVSGLRLAYGLAVDSKERFYLASKDTSGRYQLLQVATDGTVQTIADLGLTRVNGVAVNSRDEVFVGAPNNLLKIDPVTGQVSTFTTVGLPNPRNIAMDGKDNIYVQNESNIISMIKPDHSSVLLYSKGDGIVDPIFEGDGYPNIAADCADNFYIAPFSWQVIKQSGEEHVLAQVVPRTGQVSALFDGLQISSHLSDIDYLSFDRFGSRILMWTHGYNEIWQVPVTCGAISVEAHLVAQPGQVLSGFNLPPSAIVPLIDGRTEYVFSVRDVTAQGTSIGGTTELSGLILGENRPVMESAYLLFQNSFSPQEVQLPVNVPSIHVRNLVDVAVSTDRPEYPAGGTAQVSGAISNPNTHRVSGDLRVEIEDAFGASVGSVIAQPAVMGTGESLPFNAPFEIGTTVPGNYSVVARLYENNAVVAIARAGFKVLADQSGATAYSKLSLDRQAYAPSDRVVISSRATNRSLNVVLDNLRLLVRVLDPAGIALQTKEYSILQLAPGVSQSFTTDYAFRNAAPGTYHVEQTLMDSDGRAFDQHVVDYVVKSSAETGFGLTGSIMLPATEYAEGESVDITFGVNNNGNALVSALPVKLAIIAPETQQVLAEFSYTADIQAGNVYVSSANWTAVGSGGENYAVVLQAEVGGKSLVLAQAVFKIKKDLVKLELNHSLGNSARLLALSGCGKDAVLDANGLLACAQERTQLMDGMLSALPVSHFVTGDPEVFLRELRSGLYNGYWVSGKVGKIHEFLDEELREAAFRGETLLVDGAHDERNKTLDDTTGLKINGKLGSAGLPVSLSAPFDTTVLPSTGHGLKLNLSTGQVVGRFGLAQNSPVAVAANQYGYGHGLQYGFDMLGSLPLSSAGWRSAFLQGLAWAAVPLADSQVAGEVIEYLVTVANLGVATSGELRLTLPVGAVYLSASAQPLSAPSALKPQGVWNFNLSKDGTMTLSVLVRLPELPGSYDFVSEGGAVVGGVYQRNGDPLSSTISVISMLHNLDQLEFDIQNLPITLAKEVVLRDKAIGSLDAANIAVANLDYENAIGQLATAADALNGVATISVRDARYAIDRALKEAEWLWRKAQ